jgi:hypothetical protein
MSCRGRGLPAGRQARPATARHEPDRDPGQGGHLLDHMAGGHDSAAGRVVVRSFSPTPAKVFLDPERHRRRDVPPELRGRVPLGSDDPRPLRRPHLVRPSSGDQLDPFGGSRFNGDRGQPDSRLDSGTTSTLAGRSARIDSTILRPNDSDMTSTHEGGRSMRLSRASTGIGYPG